jgi:hypothetical protein
LAAAAPTTSCTPTVAIPNISTATTADTEAIGDTKTLGDLL